MLKLSVSYLRQSGSMISYKENTADTDKSIAIHGNNTLVSAVYSLTTQINVSEI
jgi:hypothetical protein